MTGLSFALFVSPWLLFSWWSSGSWVQGSAVIKHLWAVERRAGMLPPDLVRSWADLFARRWFFAPLGIALGPLPWIPLAATATAWGAVIAAPALRAMRRHEDGDLLHVTAGLLGSAGLVGAVSAALFDEFQVWYFALPGFALLVSGYAWIARAVRWRSAAASVLALVTMWGAAKFAVEGPRTSYPWQRDVYGSQAAAEGHVPVGAPIGCMNAGIPGYFSSRRIVGVDGLVNAEVLPFWRSHSTDAYLRDAGIEWILDEEGSIAFLSRFASAPIPLVTVVSWPLDGWPGGRRVLRHVTPSRAP